MTITAMVLHTFDAPLGLKTLEKQRPTPDQVLIEVHACGLCHTDLKIRSGQVPTVTLPHVMGHEVAGTVVRLGGGVSNPKLGQRVVLYPYFDCGHCANCAEGAMSFCTHLTRIGFERFGGYASHVVVPAANALPLPDSVTFEQAAVLPDALSTPYRAVQAAHIEAGQTAVVVGIGGLGVHAVQFLKLRGAHVIAVDLNEACLELAKRYGADDVIHSGQESVVAALERRTAGQGVDVVLDMVGVRQTLEASVECLKKRGRLVVVGYRYGQGFTLLPDQLVYKSLSIVGVIGSKKDDLLALIKLVEQRRIEPVVTQFYPLKQANQALEALAQGDTLGRTVLNPTL